MLYREERYNRCIVLSFSLLTNNKALAPVRDARQIAIACLIPRNARGNFKLILFARNSIR